MSGMRFIALLAAAMIVAVPIAVIETDQTSAENTWTQGDLAGYYKTNTPINDNDLYETLLYTVYFSSGVFGQDMNTVGSDSFRNISEEYGRTTKVCSDSVLDGSIDNIAGTAKATRKFITTGQLFTSNSPYSGELIQKMNQYFGESPSGTQVIVYDEFSNNMSSSVTTTYCQAMNGFISKVMKSTVRTNDSCRLDINIGSKNATLYSSVKALYVVTTEYIYSEEISVASEAPLKCDVKVSVNVQSFESNVYGYVEGTEYKGTIDKDKYISVESTTYHDVSVVVNPNISTQINASTVYVSSESCLRYFSDILGCSVSSYYPYVQDKVDSALDVHPADEGFDFMKIFESTEFKFIILMVIIAALILVVFYVLFYIKHRWF